MTDFVWPDDLVPFAQQFYLQPHTGGSESPFTKQPKTYGLSAPRWMCRMGFRGGYDGTVAQAAFGPRLDSLLAKLEGRTHRIAIYDFRRTEWRGVDTSGAGNEAASEGDTTMTITGLLTGETILEGDYIGGDGRPHIITEDAEVDEYGNAEITFKPALVAAIAEDEAIIGNPTGWFKQTSDDGGANMTEVGGLSGYDLEFVEDLNAPTDITFEDEPLTYSG